MAKVVGPLHSSEARGRMGGLIFNTWRGISYVKAACAPAQPRSTKQLNIRAWGIKLARLWQTLTAAQRQQWVDYSSTHLETDAMGSPKRLSGFNWYVRLNSRMLQMSLTPSATPPSIPAPAAPVSFAAADGVGSSVITFATEPAGSRLWLHDDGPHSAGRIPRLPKADYVTNTTATTGTYTASALAAGTHDFFARIVFASNGLASPWVTDPAIIT